MLCKEKATLLQIYVLTVRKYADAASKLSEDLGASSHENFQIVYRKAEEILQDLAAARMKFQAHLRAHGC
jgi:hypothetical protein